MYICNLLLVIVVFNLFRRFYFFRVNFISWKLFLSTHSVLFEVCRLFFIFSYTGQCPKKLNHDGKCFSNNVFSILQYFWIICRQFSNWQIFLRFLIKIFQIGKHFSEDLLPFQSNMNAWIHSNHYVKSGAFSGPYFPVFSLNTGK